MEKEELIDFIIRNRKLFGNVTDEEINIFKYSEEHELSLDIAKKIKVTPLITYISNYALISSLITNDEENELKKHLSDKKYKIVRNACDLSLDYIEFTEGNLNHPSINAVNEQINGTLFNEELLEKCSKIAEEYDDEYISDDLMDFVTEVDNTIDAIDINSFENILNKIDDLDVQDILHLLLIFVQQRTHISMGLASSYRNNNINSQKISVQDDLVIQTITLEKIDEDVDITLGEYLQLYVDIFAKIHKYIDYVNDEELIELLKELENIYMEYKNCKYSAIDNFEKAKYLLRMCHKM